MLTVERKPFAKALAGFKGLVKKSVIPIIECVVLEARDGLLAIEGTNLDQSMRLTVPADGSLPRTAVHFERVERFVSAAAGADCSLSLADDRLTIRSGRARTAIPCRKEEDFPATSTPGEHDFAAPLTMWASAIRFCSDAISSEKTRYYLAGLLLDTEKRGEPTAVATDGRGLAAFPLKDIYQEKLPQFAGVSLIVPAAAISLLVSACADRDVKTSVTPERIEFAWSGGFVRSKLIDGSFPDWRRVLKSAGDGVATAKCNLVGLAAAAGRLVAATGENGLGLSAEPDKLRMRSRGADAVADADDEIEASLTGKPFTFGVNGGYLINALKALDNGRDPEVVITFTGIGSHVRFTVAGSDALRVVMPMTAVALPEGCEIHTEAA